MIHVPQEQIRMWHSLYNRRKCQSTLYVPLPCCLEIPLLVFRATKPLGAVRPPARRSPGQQSGKRKEPAIAALIGKQPCGARSLPSFVP
jgi:hypothetical protein